MGVVVIIPESLIKTILLEDGEDIMTDDGDGSETNMNIHHNPALTTRRAETSSVTDSVELLIERRPLLFNPPHPDDTVDGKNYDEYDFEEGGSDYDENDDDDYFDDYSDTEYNMPLNDSFEQEQEGRTTTASRTTDPSIIRRQSSSIASSELLLDAEGRFHDGETPSRGIDFGDDYPLDDDDQDSIEFPSFRNSQPVPRTVILPGGTTGTRIGTTM
ncbi:unnamed protein product [Cylindrotheca closterium]|uniref:Uncharacterized protein n=1 Tax=Cylindrotheca closterium TaxID=2856 RepID=A0AAD2CS15_9STRA|nr:unnamed protein product [Cylindrotheca closterium]